MSAKRSERPNDNDDDNDDDDLEAYKEQLKQRLQMSMSDLGTASVLQEKTFDLAADSMLGASKAPAVE